MYRLRNFCQGRFRFFDYDIHLSLTRPFIHMRINYAVLLSKEISFLTLHSKQGIFLRI